MLEKEVISKNFEIKFSDGETKQYIKSDTIEYQWALTQAGGIIIYEKQMHETFGAVLKDGRRAAYAAGTWLEVNVLEDDEVPVLEAPKDYA